MTAGAPVIIVRGKSPHLLLRLVYFLVIGWWLGALVCGVAWLLNITIIGLPFGLWLINRLPTVITLRAQEQDWLFANGALFQGKPQRSFLVRALYFLAIGWWFSGLWMALAYAALLTIILIPLSFWMYGRVGAVTTLYRS